MVSRTVKGLRFGFTLLALSQMLAEVTRLLVQRQETLLLMA